MKTKFNRLPVGNATWSTTPIVIPVPNMVKRRFRGLPCFLLASLLLAPVASRQGLAGCDGFGGAGGDCGGGGGGGGGSLLMFTTSEGSATVSGVNGPILSGVVIPGSYNGLPVTSIGASAFANNFVADVTIPDSVTNIGAGAFFNCTSLTNITIGNGVTSIGQGAFDSCWRLATIKVGPLNSAFSSLAGVLFNQNQTTLFQCPMGKSGAYSIPTSVTTIGDAAFSSCYGLTRVVIPDSVTQIGNSAFAYCGSLARVTIPNRVTNIGDQLFYGCASLTNVALGNHVSRIGILAFASCANLASVTIPNGVAEIGDAAFSSCSSLSKIYFQGNPPTLGVAVFEFTVATAYYLPGTAGWGAMFGDLPTAPWSLPYPVVMNSGSNFGVRTNGFGFIISWATNVPVVVEACTDLAARTWSPVGTNTLVGGWSYFSDPQWTNHPAGFYRLRSS